MSFTTSQHGEYENPVHVYEWKAWSHFLFPSLCSNAIRIEARIRQSNADIFKKLVTNKGYFLFHVNLTKTASFFRNKEELVNGLKKRGITPLNADIKDISKNYLQSVCKQTGLHVTRASAEGDPNELLIIKTNFNYGGKPEKALLRSQSWRLNIGSRDYNTTVTYPVMERKKIESQIWSNENMIVEKYISNEHNYIYRVYKLLNKIVISEVIETGIIKKLRSVVQRTNYFYELRDDKVLPGGNMKFDTLLTDILRLVKAFNLDFAAIDVVRSDENKYYIIDVNITPNWNRNDHTEVLNFLCTALCREEIINMNYDSQNNTRQNL